MTSNCGAPPLSAPSAPAKIRRHQSPRADAAPQKQWPRLLSRRCLSACQADKGRTTSVWRLYPVTLRRATRQRVREERMRMKTGGELCLKGGMCQSFPTAQMITIVYSTVWGENTWSHESIRPSSTLWTNQHPTRNHWTPQLWFGCDDRRETQLFVWKQQW